jgi:hypothetical protein
MQSSEFWDLAVWRMRWGREVGVVEREFKNVSQVEFGVVPDETNLCEAGRSSDIMLIAVGISERWFLRALGLCCDWH